MTTTASNTTTYNIESIRTRPEMYLGELSPTALVLRALDDIQSINAQSRKNLAYPSPSGVRVVLQGDQCAIFDHHPMMLDLHHSYHTHGYRKEVLDSLILNPDKSPYMQRNALPLIAALSSTMRIQTVVDGVWYEGTYQDQKLAGWISTEAPKDCGEYRTRIQFTPDSAVFDTPLNGNQIRHRLQAMSATTPGFIAELQLSDEFTERISVKDMVELANIFFNQFDPSLSLNLKVAVDSVGASNTSTLVSFDLSLHWGATNPEFFAWVNGDPSPEGSHVLAIRESLLALHLDQIPYGICLAVTIKEEPQFYGACKNTFRNTLVRKVLRDHLEPALKRCLDNETFAMAFDWAHQTKSHSVDEP